MTTTKAERDKTREICEATTDGEWEAVLRLKRIGERFTVFTITDNNELDEICSLNTPIESGAAEANANLIVHAKAYLRKYANEIDRLYERVYGQEEYVATELAPLLNRTMDLTEVGGGKDDPDPLMHLELWVDMVVDKVEELRVALHEIIALVHKHRPGRESLRRQEFDEIKMVARKALGDSDA